LTFSRYLKNRKIGLYINDRINTILLFFILLQSNVRLSQKKHTIDKWVASLSTRETKYITINGSKLNYLGMV